MNGTHRSTTTSDPPPQLDASDAATRSEPVPAPPAPRSSGVRIPSLVVGGVLAFMAVVLLGSGGTVLWADLTKRDPAGFLTSDAREFSTSGAALTSQPTDLGSAGVGWLYSPGLLEDVRVSVTPTGSGPTLFVGIGSSDDVDRYLDGIDHSVVSNFFGSSSIDHIAGNAPGTPPDGRDFWVASSSGTGPQTVSWDPAPGTWTVVIMNADGRTGIEPVRIEFGATMPSLVWIAVGLLVAGGVLLAGALLLITSAVRQRNRMSPRTA